MAIRVQDVSSTGAFVAGLIDVLERLRTQMQANATTTIQLQDYELENWMDEAAYALALDDYDARLASRRHTEERTGRWV